jgi:hypothetical protein
MKRSKEYSLAELLDHPVLGVMMANAGIERRSLDLILDTDCADRRHAAAELHELGIANYGK